MNKYLKGYLIGKAVEITIAGTAMLVAKSKGLITAEIHPNFKEDALKRAKRKRLAR